jgi:hypothetical protein
MPFRKQLDDGELERLLSGLGLTRSTYRALLLLPLVYVAWADGNVQNVERELILKFAGTRLHLTTETMKVIEGWLEKAPTKEYIESGLQGLLGIALDESMLEVDVSELPDLVVHAEALAAATAETLHDPTSVTPEEEEALAEIAALLQVDSGSSWKSVLEAVRTMRPPGDPSA